MYRTFTVDPRTDYFILREDQLYDMYINGEYVVTISISEEKPANQIKIRRLFSN